jgi:hypothetical protein
MDETAHFDIHTSLFPSPYELTAQTTHTSDFGRIFQTCRRYISTKLRRNLVGVAGENTIGSENRPFRLRWPQVTVTKGVQNRWSEFVYERDIEDVGGVFQ